MFPSKLSRKLTPANIDSLGLPFLYRTKTILAASSDVNNDSAEPQRSKRRRRVEPSQDSLESESTATSERRTPQERYDGSKAHAYARGAASKYNRAKDTDQLKRPRTTRSRSTDRPERKSNVPFDTPYQRLSGSTITWSELKRFENLFQIGISDKDTSGKKTTRTSAKTSTSSKQPRSTSSPKPEFPDLLRPLAEEAAMLRAQKRSNLEISAEQQDQAVKSNERATRYLSKVKSLMDNAKFDTELWQVLEDEVFAKIESLRLRDDDGVDARLQAATTKDNLRDFQPLTDTLSAILLHYMKLIQSTFPGSSLGLTLLPSLKRLGSSAFALGATTDLYNEHMRLLFKQYTDLDGMCNIMSEMDKEVYEFNVRTQSLLNEIFEYANLSKRGQNGPGLQALWLTDRKARALVKLTKWKEVVDERVTATAMKDARAKAADLAGDELDIK